LIQSFLEELIKEIQQSSADGPKHIIRFRSRKDYAECLRSLRGTGSSVKQKIQRLAMIYSLSCPLRSAARLSDYPFIAGIEADPQMTVHALPHASSAKGSALPAGTKPLIPWGVKRIKAPLVWNLSKGEQIGVGVIDTGVDYSHPDLRGAIGRGINLVNRGMPPVDDNGHGTHISGTIAAFSGTGIIGTAPKAVIHPVKAFDRNGSAYVSDIIYGMDWCVKNRIPIINMSFGMRKYSRALEDAVRNAYRAGVVIVASSGNDKRSVDIDYPACFPQTISVGATNRQRRVASFSNRGRYIDIYAPGNKIYSTWLHGRYNELSGTSMATSHVSGVIALMLARHPGLTPRRIKSLLKRQATSLIHLRKTGRTIQEVNAKKTILSLPDR